MAFGSSLKKTGNGSVNTHKKWRAHLAVDKSAEGL
jgi:hypothetical protein